MPPSKTDRDKMGLGPVAAALLEDTFEERPGYRGTTMEERQIQIAQAQVYATLAVAQNIESLITKLEHLNIAVRGARR